MLKKSDIIYVYDGSFDGLLTCVFESFERHELPFVIVSENDFVPTLFESRIVVTNSVKAQRVKNGIKGKAGKGVWNLVRLGFLTCLDDKGALINDFIHMAMSYGEGVTRMLADDTVNRLYKAVKALMQESHKYLGFVRFSMNDGFLMSVIEPKNYVLELIAPHFCDRFSNESFLIYDSTHNEALLYHEKEKMIIPMNSFIPPEASEEELFFRQLWKHLYDAVEIKERRNEKCRMNFMPKRYWAELTEMQVQNDSINAKICEKTFHTA